MTDRPITQPEETPNSGLPRDENITDILLERIIGRSDLLAVAYMDLGLQASRSVGCIRLFRSGRNVGSGSGFMVSPRLLMTNNHVLRSAAIASDARLVFNFQDDSYGNALQTTTCSFEPDTFFLTSPDLDYTLVAVAQCSTEGRAVADFGWTRLIEDEGKIINGEYVTIIQHPNGHPKQIALRENQVRDILENYLHYHTDTAPGSSGSPVFNDQWEVVCLHHSGVPKRDAQGRILTRNDTPWTSSMDESEIHWVANEGIRISRIVKHVKAQRLGIGPRRLLDQLLEGTRPKPKEQGGSPQLAKLPASDPQDVGLPHIEKGMATWTIPLRVSIQLGDAFLQDSRRTTTRNDFQPSDLISGIVDNPELQTYLEEARRAQTRPYYDEGLDEEDMNAYYASISQSDTPLKLFRKLSQLVTRTHTTQLSYKPSRDLYPWVDLRPSLKLYSVYSGKEFDPEEVIREDFRIEQARTARLKEITLRESIMNVEQIRLELDLLEAEFPYNCEHVVPQSWFDKQEPMRGDLHHLFSCEPGCNSFRGNTPYYDFPVVEEAERGKCGKRVENKFEPEEGKGPAARATLYFLLRYPGEIDEKATEYTKDRIKILLQWHADHPVDLYEKHRNRAIFEKQGNRNPLIDHPKLANKVDFILGLGK